MPLPAVPRDALQKATLSHPSSYSFPPSRSLSPMIPFTRDKGYNFSGYIRCIVRRCIVGRFCRQRDEFRRRRRRWSGSDITEESCYREVNTIHGMKRGRLMTSSRRTHFKKGRMKPVTKPRSKRSLGGRASGILRVYLLYYTRATNE